MVPPASGSRGAPPPSSAATVPGPLYPAAARRVGGGGRHKNDKPPRVIVVSTVSAARNATRELSKHQTIGFDCEGVALSRTGSIELVQASIPGTIYLFDVHDGRDIFEKGGLKNLLERKQTIKVVHDSRHDSDGLWHQYGVNLSPVIDTQCAFGEVRALRGLSRGLPASLRTVLRKFANVSDEEVALKVTIKECMKQRPDFWANRPLTKEMIAYASFDVQYLVRAVVTMRKIVESIDPAGWKNVEKQSREYCSMFRDDPSGKGPEKATRMYETMARQAARERSTVEFAKSKERMVKKDGLRNFSFDQDKLMLVMAEEGGSIGDKQMQQSGKAKRTELSALSDKLRAANLTGNHPLVLPKV